MSYQKNGRFPKNALSKLNAQPSPASTNRPSASEYGSLLASTTTTSSSSNGSLIQMPSNNNSNNNPNYLTDFIINDEEVIESIHASTRRSRSAMIKKGGLAIIILVGAIVLVVAIVVGAIVVQDESSPTTTTTNHHRHNNNKNNNNNNKNLASTNSVHAQHGLISRAARTFSDKHPVHDLKIPRLERPAFSLPNPALFDNNHNNNNNKATTKAAALPTNAWYQNLLLPMGSTTTTSVNNPTEEQRVYPVPYLVDVVGPIPGLRLHHPTVIAADHVVQVVQVLNHGLTVGASTQSHFFLGNKKPVLSNQYGISKMTPLGITLEWKDNSKQPNEEQPLTFSSSIVRGMPYATMQYNSNQQQQQQEPPTSPSPTVATSRLKKKLLQEHHHKKSAHNLPDIMLPTIASEIPITGAPILDGTTELACNTGSDDSSEPQLVQGEVELSFAQSDYTWLVFLSRPVYVQCILPPAQEAPEFVPGQPIPSSGVVFALQFLDEHQENDDTSDLVIRVALANDCTHGTNPQSCGRADEERHVNQTAYTNLLRKHADLYPGPDTDISFDFVKNETTGQTASATHMKFNWNVQSMKHGEIFDDRIDNSADTVLNGASHEHSRGKANLLMYALPHHQDMIAASTIHAGSSEQQQENQESSFPTYEVAGDAHSDIHKAKFCKHCLLGPTCLVEGSTWSLREEHKRTSFRAPRPPQNDTLPALAKALRGDLNFKLPSYFERGAGDTYFSGKMLAKLGRILTIGEELSEICSDDNAPEECSGLDIPSPDSPEFQTTVARLRSNVEVWINGTGEIPFVYDGAWGGLVSCGCDFDGDDEVGVCRNKFPDCPAFYDPGLNFGNAYYNDHHFHYGYHIYSAAIVAHFDPQWGRDHFEQVILLIRDIGNPSHTDTAFPTFRHKDWYQGSSWASGIAVSPLNGRNQESSSEAIAAYEAIALYGKEMVQAWEGHNQNNQAVAEDIFNYGGLLSASELRSADRYWHVIEASERRQYPTQYKPHVIGILWNTMAQFQTWFGPAPYLAIGIQLLPLTAVSEERDSQEWARELYEPFAESCGASFDDCRGNGWSVLVLAILATVGHRDAAIKKALEIPESAFTSAGGNGHSLTNTLWYLATRPQVVDPLLINPSKESDSDLIDENLEPSAHESDTTEETVNTPEHQHHASSQSSIFDESFDCSCPKTCDHIALDQFAIGHTCRDRIVWLVEQDKHNEWDACHQVGVEFPEHCGACDPRVCSAEKQSHSKTCPPCSKDVCRDPKLNLCPVQNAPYLCTDGPSTGGCSRYPWDLEDVFCRGCCELTPGCDED